MKRLNLLKETLHHMEYYNSMAPFPVYDTGIVGDLRDYIKLMEKERNDYDDLPVASCRHCLDLFVIEDEVGNDICGRCGSVNEIRIFKSIDEYLAERERIKESS